MAETIITRLELDLGGYDQQINQAVGGMKRYDDATVDATKDTKTFENALGSASGKLNMTKVATEGVAKATAQVNTETQKVGKSGSQVSGISGLWERVKGSVSNAAGSVKSFFLGAEDGVKTAVKDVGGLRGIFSQVGANIKGVFSGIGKSFGQVEGQGQKIGGLSGVWNKVKASVGSATKTVTEFVKGSRDGVRDAVKGVGGLRGAFAQASGNVSKFFGGIASGAQSAVTQIPGVGQAFALLANPIVAATAAVGFLASNIVTRLDGASKTVDALKFSFDGVLNRLTSFEGFKGFFDPTQQLKDAAFAQAQAELLDEIDASQRKVNSSNAEAEKRIASLNQKLRDRTRTDEERLSIASEITNIEVQRANKEEELLKKKLAGIDLEIAAAKSQGIAADQINDELLNRQNEAQVALVNAQTARIALTENVERRVNSITEQGANERAAQAAKEAAAREKADAKLKADTERRIALINELNAASAATEGPRQQEEQKATATRDDRIKRAEGDTQTLLKIEQEYQAEIQAIRDKAAQDAEAVANEQAQALQDAQLGAAQTRLDRLKEEQELALEIAKANGEDVTALLFSQAQERDGVEKEIQDIRLAQLEEQYQREYEALDGNLIAQYDRQAQYEIDKAALLNESAVSELEAKRQLLEQTQELEAAEVALGQTRIDASAQAAETISTIAGESKAAAATAFAAQKAAAIAQVITNTNAGLAAASAAAAAIPPLIPPGVPNPAYPVAQAIYGATVARVKLQAAASLAQILAQSVSGFDKGGDIKRGDGPRISKAGGDNILVTGQVGEKMLNKRQQAELERIAGKNIWGEIGLPGYSKPNHTYRDRRIGVEAIPMTSYVSTLTGLNSYAEGRGDTYISNTTTTQAKLNDRRMVAAVDRTTREARKQTELLAMMAQKGRRPNKRYHA
ncbi:MAG TPA: hypothetical protein PKJ19_03185 [Flavobacteriales bacterium]|nr:hypothetical protein [Flavobacteriales bacterium]HNU56667.1 hypothetical protein [Flavobacteriales bacterium]